MDDGQLVRHNCASWLVASGESAGVIAARLGQADPAFAIKTYVDTDGNEQNNASEKLPKILAG